jgi:hypothetical protein
VLRQNSQILFPQDGAAEDAALAVEPFGGRVDDKVGAEFNGSLTDRGGETVVYIKDKVVFVGEVGGGFEVDDVQCGVGGCFQVDHFGIGPDGGFPGLWIGGIDVAVFDAIFGEIFCNDGMGAAENAITG